MCNAIRSKKSDVLHFFVSNYTKLHHFACKHTCKQWQQQNYTSIHGQMLQEHLHLSKSRYASMERPSCILQGFENPVQPDPQCPKIKCPGIRKQISPLHPEVTFIGFSSQEVNAHLGISILSIMMGYFLSCRIG